ncbi:ATP-binding cassette sub-family C member 8-like [Strongylocentrotus purpuratus]|uniref:Uncharacterized protein n=1 Tax=Strongylocentrotus purpuratus TaxID=7668 RepID=A0A7M7PSS5_STRPU|nr:ATP-binding cassette sub-family C member 8-like [Strongylocentrotus purpuratus]
MTSSEWDWFCGVNYTLDSGTGLNNSCLINGIIVVPQLGFIFFSSVFLVLLASCSSRQSLKDSKYLLRLPGHTPRWLLTYVLLILTLSFIAEGILTNDTFLANSLPQQPHLYVAGVMCGACGVLQNSDQPDDTKKENMNFFHDYEPLPSSLTYWWMDWLFTLGYRKPIEPSDLGSIPDKHTADAIHAIFKKNYLNEKKRAQVKGQNMNFWRVYIRTYGVRMMTAGMFKLTADMLQFVGPLCISGIVNFVTAGEKKIPSPHHVTVTEFLANGYVLVGCITVSAFTRHTFDQTYYYWTAVEGVHIKSAIQVRGYNKS